MKAIGNLMAGARFDAHASATILLDVWEKWVFLAALAGGTCPMRAAIGGICAATGGTDLLLRLLAECRAVAAAEGYPPREAFLDHIRPVLTVPSPLFTMVGDLVRRGRGQLLPIVYTHLKAYEARRARTLSEGA